MEVPEFDVAAFEQFERSGWEQRRSEPYHRLNLTTRSIDSLLDAANVKAGTSLLDVATGPGYAAAGAVERGATAIGVDLSEDMLALARKLHPDIDFHRVHAGELPFKDGSFDSVVANFLMPHVADLPHVVREFARVTRPGGRVALTTWDLPERNLLFGVILQAVFAAGATPPEDLPAGPSPFQFSQDDEFAVLLTGARLVDPRVETLSLVHTTADWDAGWDDFVKASVRIAAVYQRQDDDTQARIRAEARKLAEPFRTENGHEIPVSIKLGSARKP